MVGGEEVDSSLQIYTERERIRRPRMGLSVEEGEAVGGVVGQSSWTAVRTDRRRGGRFKPPDLDGEGTDPPIANGVAGGGGEAEDGRGRQWEGDRIKLVGGGCGRMELARGWERIGGGRGENAGCGAVKNIL